MVLTENTCLLALHKMSVLSHKTNDHYCHHFHFLQQCFVKICLHLSIPFYTQPKLAASTVLTEGFGECCLFPCE